MSNKFIIGTDTEKFLEAQCTGLKTCAGALLTVNFNYAKPAAGGAISAQRTANLMHIVLHADHILKIHDTNVRVFGFLSNDNV